MPATIGKKVAHEPSSTVMKNLYIGIAVLVIAIAGIFFYLTTDRTESVSDANTPLATTTETWECNADAKICPDGSAVGRSGPKCEFTSCPSPAATSGTVTTYMGGSATTLNITVNPKELVSDSRCPQDVQCIWAGTVEVRTIISSKVAHGEHVLTLGKPQVFGDFTVTLTKVTPEPNAGQEIPISSYRFTYVVKKR